MPVLELFLVVLETLKAGAAFVAAHKSEETTRSKQK